MNHPFKGNTVACLKHLAIAIGNDTAKRDVIARFADVDSSTVRRWFKDERTPIGEPLVRTRFYLELLGYDVEELQALDAVVRDAARMFSFGVASIPEIVQLVGYTEGRSGIETVIAVFRGAQGISRKKHKDLEAFVEMNREIFAEKKRMVKRIEIGTVNQLPVRSVQSALSPRQRFGECSPLDLRRIFIESAAKQVLVLLPLMRAIESDAFSAEERTLLRELSGGDGVFKLANILTRLCGERTRAMHSSQQQSAIRKE